MAKQKTEVVEATPVNEKKSEGLKESKEEKEKREALSFTKRFIIFIIINAEIQIYLSYILGFLGKDNIAETLSTQVVVTVLGSIGFYCIKSLVENVNKYPSALFKKPKKDDDEENE